MRPSITESVDVPRLIGDSQTERWYDSIECFLSEFLEQEPRAAPFYDTSANLWLMNLDERLEHRGSFWAPPKPSICALYKVCQLCVTQASVIVSPPTASAFQMSWGPQPLSGHSPSHNTLR